jgi:DHA2 family multidrug resistance protein
MSAAPLERSAAGGRNPWLVAIVISIATFMQVLDTSIANVALRNIGGSIGASYDESTWIITSYLISSAVVLPVSGWLAAVIGRKRFYMLCVAVFTVFSVACAFATSLTILIVFRVLQGIGGGGMAPSEQAMLADTFEPRRRGQAFALYGIAVIVAPTVGPTLGGWLTDSFSWHWIFLINAPVGLLSLFLVHWLVSEPAVMVRERRERLAAGLDVDWAGLALVALALGCLEVVLDQGQRQDWFQSDFIIAVSAVSAVSFLLLFPWEMSRTDPVVEVRLLFQRQFGTSFLMMLTVGAILFSSVQILPQLLQTEFGYTAMLAGMSQMPGGIAMLLMMPLAGRLSGVVQPKYLMAFGMVVIAAAMWHFTGLAPGADWSYFVWARGFQMVGLPFLFVPITIASYADVAPDKTGHASALINVARYVGGSIGISIVQTMLAQGQQVHQSRLTAHLVPSSLQYQAALRRIGDWLIRHGADAAGAREQAQGVIAQAVHRQAALLSYIDVYAFYALVALAMVGVSLLLLRRVDLGSPKAAH